jgi:hypothetical protein
MTLIEYFEGLKRKLIKDTTFILNRTKCICDPTIIALTASASAQNRIEDVNAKLTSLVSSSTLEISKVTTLAENTAQTEKAAQTTATNTQQQ